MPSAVAVMLARPMDRMSKGKGHVHLATMPAKPCLGNKELRGKEEAVAERQQDGAAVGGEGSSLTISSEL